MMVFVNEYDFDLIFLLKFSPLQIYKNGTVRVGVPWAFLTLRAKIQRRKAKKADAISYACINRKAL